MDFRPEYVQGIRMDADLKASLSIGMKLNGYVILRGFLPLDLIESLHAQVSPLLEGSIRRLKGDSSELRGPRRICIDLPPFIKHLGGPLEDPRFRRHPIVEELADAVLGRWRYGVTKAECPLPGSQYMQWHADSDGSGASRDPSGRSASPSTFRWST